MYAIAYCKDVVHMHIGSLVLSRCNKRVTACTRKLCSLCSFSGTILQRDPCTHKATIPISAAPRSADAWFGVIASSGGVEPTLEPSGPENGKFETSDLDIETRY
jgi:hypothetical protein